MRASDTNKDAMGARRGVGGGVSHSDQARDSEGFPEERTLENGWDCICSNRAARALQVEGPGGHRSEVQKCREPWKVIEQGSGRIRFAFEVALAPGGGIALARLSNTEA